MENNNVKLSETSLESLYLKKDFKGAKEFLLKHRDIFNSGQYHYNLGTLDLKLGVYPVARYHLERALQSGYLHPKVYKNLQISTELLEVKSSEAQMTYWDQFLFIGKSLPADGLIGASLLLMVFLALAWYRKWIRSVKAICSFAVIALIPLVLYALMIPLDVAIVLKKVSLREGPSAIYSETVQIEAGHKIILGERNGQWYFVRSPLKFAGWIEASNLGLL